MRMESPYTLEQAERFRWSSVSGQLHPDRVELLDENVRGARILDAGCAGGGYVEYLAREDRVVVGVDRHQELLPADAERRRGRYVQADITALPFRDKSFDCAYCFDVLEHVDDRAALLELARVTAGRIIITVPREDAEIYGFGLTFSHYQDKTHLRNYTEESLRRLVSTVPASRAEVFPRLPISTKHFVRAMVRGADATSFWGKVPHRLLSRLLDHVPYRSVHTGLVAVVDL